MTAAFHDAGIAYCLEHSGTRNEDESGHCDWYDRNPGGGSGPTACRLVPLVFFDDAPAVTVEVES